ncbi:MAG: AAA family ATPase [Magnetospirillum sp.]|nr:AAA family ATPase [Magnetospirillum sp.]
MAADAQAPVLAVLSDPATYGGLAPARVDTHISSVFLAGDRVYKLKKAVRLTFLDFSTLAARKTACEAEFAINSRAAPGLYLGVVPVVRGKDGALALGGEGEAVDYVVAMRRFDEDSLFRNLVRRGALDRGLLRDLTETVVAFHRAAPVRRDKGGAAAMARTLDDNEAAMLPHVPHLLPAEGVARLTRLSRDWLARLAPLLDSRREQGFVRQCHGDLHLGNICLFEGRPTLFDAIEFSEDIACIDVAYDLAFLLMDLDAHHARDLASQVMNHALDLTGDYPAVAAMPFFLSLRAGVRALVTATTAAGSAGAERERLGAEGRSYLAAALAYLDPPPPRLVAVGGLSGSGKSRMGRRLAPLLGVPGAVVVRSDALRKQLTGAHLRDRLGPEGYAPEVTERTYRSLFDTCAMLLKAGSSVVADAVFARPEQRAAIERVAAAAGVPFAGLWLEAPEDVAAARIGGRTGDASDATVEVLARQRQYDLGPIAWKRLDTSQPGDGAFTEACRALGV